MKYFIHVGGVACFDPSMVNFYSTTKQGNLGVTYTIGFRAGNVMEIMVTYGQEQKLAEALQDALKG